MVARTETACLQGGLVCRHSRCHQQRDKLWVRLESDRDKILMRKTKSLVDGSGAEMTATPLFPESNIFRQFFWIKFGQTSWEAEAKSELGTECEEGVRG